jgi:hypothetical protein
MYIEIGYVFYLQANKLSFRIFHCHKDNYSVLSAFNLNTQFFGYPENY